MSNDDHNDSDKQPNEGDGDKPTRDARGRWLPNHCPNPDGRPKKKRMENIELGRKLVRRGLDAAPSLAWLWGSQGFLTLFNGDPTEALAAFDTAQRLDPRDPLSYRINIGTGMANFLVGDHATALGAGLEALEQSPRNMAALRIVIMSSVELGDEARAREYTQRLLTLRPGFRIGSWLDRHPVRHNAQSGRYRESLRKAGLPD